MHIVINDTSYKLVKAEELDDYIEYDVYKTNNLIGRITKVGAEIYYTGRDLEGNIRGSAATLKDTLEAMVLNMFYARSYKGDRFIKTLGLWYEGEELKVEYTKNNIVKHAKRVVRYSKSAGDLYIVLDNNKYFLYEFD